MNISTNFLLQFAYLVYNHLDNILMSTASLAISRSTYQDKEDLYYIVLLELTIICSIVPFHFFLNLKFQSTG